VPAQLADLLGDPAWTPPPTLRAVLLGGAAAPPALIDAAIARGVPVLPTYGMTETFGQIATARVPGGPLQLLPGVTVTGGTRAAPALLRVRAPMLATRYLDGTPIAPELVTTDLGFVEGDTLHVVGRADDVIISGGDNVHPAQVEAVLAATPGVLAAVAFGAADPRWGQVVAVALAVDARFDRAAAIASWHDRLPPFARPRRIALVAELPRLSSGKLDRRNIRSLPTSPIEYA
jgi:O-succinylbenzoic acid--CoA ligase